MAYRTESKDILNFEAIIDIQNNSYIDPKQDQSDGKQYFSIKNLKLLSQAKGQF